MKIEWAGVVAIITMLGGMPAVPAVANPGWDAGAYSGHAQVGKAGTCQQNGVANVSGPGLGLPVLNGHKNAVYEFTGPVAVSAGGLLAGGTIQACGYLTEQLDKLGLGLGAACLASKGYDGQGRIDFVAAPDVSLHNIEWKASAAGFFLLTADVQDLGKSKNIGEFVSVVRVAPKNTLDCASKAGGGGSKSGGIVTFLVLGAYSVAPVLGTLDQNKPAITCKSDADPLCFYGDKKQGGD